MKLQWNQIDWKKAEEQVNRLQIRIVKATLEQKWRLVKRLQYLMTNSFYAKALAVKRVVTNRGKKTPGIDGELWKSNKEKIDAVRNLDCQTYHAKPLKRVYIEKFGKKEKRPLGIPTMSDRAMQALQLLALEPVAETTADRISFGFRKYRSPEDAREYAFSVLSRKDSPQWTLEGDIKSCFDKISHQWMLENIPTNKRIMKEFMRCGYIEKGHLYPTIEGSVISPLLANIYLNTLDRLWEKYGLTHGILVRYADDTVIICKNKKSANHALNLLQYIMAKLDLKLHPVKTKIVSMWDGKEGFDFLGMHHRRMTTETRKGQLYKETYQYPSRKAMKKMKAEVKRNVNRRSLLVAKEEDLIKNLNPKITGWKNYYSTKRNEKWMKALDWYIICTFTRWYNKKHQRRNRMSKVGFVKNSIYGKGLKKMARA